MIFVWQNILSVVMLMRWKKELNEKEESKKQPSKPYMVWKRHPFWHADQQPLTTAEVKTFQSSIYIFISLSSRSHAFSRVCYRLGNQKYFLLSLVQAASFPSLEYIIRYLLWILHVCFEGEKGEKRKKASMNNETNRRQHKKAFRFPYIFFFLNYKENIILDT